MATLILAKFFGLYFLAVGIAFALNPSNLPKLYEQMRQNQIFLFFGGIIAILLGAFVVSIHNDWVAGWPVIITILGWWSLIKGFGLIAYPGFADLFAPMYKMQESFYRGMGIVFALLGLFLAYQGW